MFGSRHSLVLLLALACSREPTTAPTPVVLHASDLYDPRVGQVWTFVNGYGDTTTITIEAAPDSTACRGGRNSVWHYRKNAARAYWLPSIAGAEIQFVLHQDADSSWRSTASIQSLPHSCPWCNGATGYTWDILDNVAAETEGYRIIPPTLSRGDTVSTGETHADADGIVDSLTFGCVVPPGQLTTPAGHGAAWRTDFYVEDVVTPVYSGPASVSEQWENCDLARDNLGCGHEKWWFAPGWGLVKVWQIDSGSGHEGDEDPRITMVRVH